VKLWMARVHRGDKLGLIPTDEAGRKALSKMVDGECVEVEIIRPRSLPMHKRLFAILTDIGENSTPNRDPEDILDELKILAGHYEVMHVRDPESGSIFEVRRPKSIAFARLTHDEFMRLWPSLEQAGIERFGYEFWMENSA